MAKDFLSSLKTGKHHGRSGIPKPRDEPPCPGDTMNDEKEPRRPACRIASEGATSRHGNRLLVAAPEAAASPLLAHRVRPSRVAGCHALICRRLFNIQRSKQAPHASMPATQSRPAKARCSKYVDGAKGAPTRASMAMSMVVEPILNGHERCSRARL